MLWWNSNQQTIRTVILKWAVLLTTLMSILGLQRQFSAKISVARFRGGFSGFIKRRFVRVLKIGYETH